MLTIDQCVDEVSRRGGETEIRTGRQTWQGLSVRDTADGLTLVGCKARRYYTRRESRPASLAYLCGSDNGHAWAVRVPGTMRTVEEALAWLTPADVKKAQDAGKRVRRQGDVYAVETTRAYDLCGRYAIPESHVFDDNTRFLLHRPDDGHKHRPLRLPWPVRFVQQRALAMGRSGRWGDAD